MKINKVFLGLILVCMLVFSGCASKTVEEIKQEENVGEKVTISGTADGVVKLGKISGYTVTDENGDSIFIASDNLPEEDSKVTVSGTLIKDSIFGYYIKE